MCCGDMGQVAVLPGALHSCPHSSTTAAHKLASRMHGVPFFLVLLWVLMVCLVSKFKCVLLELLYISFISLLIIHELSELEKGGFFILIPQLLLKRKHLLVFECIVVLLFSHYQLGLLSPAC